ESLTGEYEAIYSEKSEIENLYPDLIPRITEFSDINGFGPGPFMYTPYGKTNKMFIDIDSTATLLIVVTDKENNVVYIADYSEVTTGSQVYHFPNCHLEDKTGIYVIYVLLNQELHIKKDFIYLYNHVGYCNDIINDAIVDLIRIIPFQVRDSQYELVDTLIIFSENSIEIGNDQDIPIPTGFNMIMLDSNILTNYTIMVLDRKEKFIRVQENATLANGIYSIFYSDGDIVNNRLKEMKYYYLKKNGVLYK
ncbi:MAG: hypothetical protein GY839_07320, partial [candidate division Zixibacteria bacterium]|nr:hypothetical protein [candidate division Zixibacteria bacterium]